MRATSKKVSKNSYAVLQSTKKPSRLFIHNYSAKEIKEAIVSLHSGNCPLEELIAVGEAAFQFIYHTDLDADHKNAFFHLERLFNFYKNLIQAGSSRIIMIKKD